VVVMRVLRFFFLSLRYKLKENEREQVRDTHAVNE
jgi:hypothetical protein